MSEKEGDVLDELRRIDKAVKAKVLVERITHLKKLARQMNELREETNATLDELGLSKSDAKRVVDYVNESPSVKLTQAEKTKINERVASAINRVRSDVVNDVNDVNVSQLMTYIDGSTTTWANSLPMTYTTSSSSGSPVYYSSPSVGYSNAGNAFVNASCSGAFYIDLDNGQGTHFTLKL